MKNCVNCGFETPNETLGCPSCSTTTFVSSSPEALGHIISPEEKHFWDKMTFRQFAVFYIRLQALWEIFGVVFDVTYLLEHLTPNMPFSSHVRMIVVRIGLHLMFALFCITRADRIVSWFVKDIIPKTPHSSGR